MFYNIIIYICKVTSTFSNKSSGVKVQKFGPEMLGRRSKSTGLGNLTFFFIADLQANLYIYYCSNS